MARRLIIKKEYLTVMLCFHLAIENIVALTNMTRILQELYGDYNKLPQKENRVSRHNIIYYDLETSYKNNREKYKNIV